MSIIFDNLPMVAIVAGVLLLFVPSPATLLARAMRVFATGSDGSSGAMDYPVDRIQAATALMILTDLAHAAGNHACIDACEELAPMVMRGPPPAATPAADPNVTTANTE